MIKKFLALSLIVAACYACNNNETKSTTGTDTTAAKPAAEDPTKNPDYAKGLALIAGADCLPGPHSRHAAPGSPTQCRPLSASATPQIYPRNSSAMPPASARQESPSTQLPART